jgi:hypothetical protein
MDQKYRGYVYGGKVNGTFGGGITSAETTKTATNPTRTTGYYLKDVSSHTLWNAPKYTQYKAKKVNMYGAKATDTFKVDQAATKTKEGSLYYHVTDVNNSAISGWIYAGKGYVANATSQDLGGLSLTMSDAAATNDNSVKVVYRANGAQVATATWITNAAGTKAGATVGTDATNAAGTKLADFVTNSLPSGYTTTGTANTAAATYGNTVYVDVTAAATSKVQLVADNVEAKATVANPLAKGAKLSAADLTATLSATGVKALTGTKGTQIGKTNLIAIKDEFGTAAITGTKTYYAANGDAYHYVFTFESNNFTTDNRLATYGDNLTASFKAVLTKGAPKNTSSNSNWIA